MEDERLEELEARIDNLKSVIEVIEFELQKLLEEKERIENPQKIGFIYGQKSNEEKATR